MPACDTGKYALFATSILVLARIVVHTCILAEKSHQIRNQHLRFAQDQSNNPSVRVAYALAEIKFRWSYYGRCRKRFLKEFSMFVWHFRGMKFDACVTPKLLRETNAIMIAYHRAFKARSWKS